MRSGLFLFIIVFCGSTLFSQSDSTIFSDNQPDGIYLTYHDFRRNNFIGKDQVISSLDKDQLEFIGKVMGGDKFSFRSGEGSLTVECRTAWGFFQNKTLYVNFRGDFYRVPVFGSICYLVATVMVVSNGLYDPMFGYGMGTMRTKEIREFMINFYDGNMTEFSVEKAEALLSRDEALFAEYKQLSRRQRKDQLNRYIRRYNELHPVYFLN